jgi:hypothetical protein
MIDNTASSVSAIGRASVFGQTPGLRRRVAQRAMADEAAMAGDLASEQTRWTDLNQRMEALEAALGAK